MKRLVCSVCLLLGLFVVSPPSLLSNTPSLLNRIQGQVFDQSNTPVPDVDVELLNEVDSLLSRTKTNSAGSFTFFGVSSGHFQVRVLPFKTNLMSETKDVEVTPLRAGGSDSVYVDFYLRVDKRKAGLYTDGRAEAVFVQEVPAEARKLYESGVKKFEKDASAGLSDLEAAVNIFPNYFDALTTLGREYVSRKEYEKGYQYLLRAIDVNQKSPGNYYSLAYAFYQLNQISAAVKAAQACVTLNAAAFDPQLLLGTLLRIDGNYKDAETTLVKAKSLVKKPNPEVYWQLALVYNKTNRNQDAARELESFLKASPDSPDKKKVEDLIAKLKSSKS